MVSLILGRRDHKRSPCVCRQEPVSDCITAHESGTTKEMKRVFTNQPFVFGMHMVSLDFCRRIHKCSSIA